MSRSLESFHQAGFCEILLDCCDVGKQGVICRCVTSLRNHIHVVYLLESMRTSHKEDIVVLQLNAYFSRTVMVISRIK